MDRILPVFFKDQSQTRNSELCSFEIDYKLQFCFERKYVYWILMVRFFLFDKSSFMSYAIENMICRRQLFFSNGKDGSHSTF